MRVYLDLVFLINFFFDLILIFSVAIILRRNTSLFRIILGSFLGSISIFSLFISISSFVLFLIKIVISIIMVISSFGFKNIKYTLNNLFYLYMTSIIMGGFLYLLNVEYSYKSEGIIFYNNGLKINFIFLIISVPIFIIIYLYNLKKLKNNYANYYNICIYFKDGQSREFTGFMDTGNNLYDPYFNRPIILISKKDINYKYDDNLVLVPYDTINNHGLLKCLVVESIYVLGVGRINNVLVGIYEDDIKIDGVNCILHKDILKEGLCI